MKFKTKVLITNIILLSVAISTVGFFMIKKNFELALDSQIRNAIDENNLIQSTLEYDLLDITNQTSSYNIETSMVTALTNSLNSIPKNQTVIYVVYNGKLIFTNSDGANYPENLWSQTEVGKKVYSIEKSENSYFIITSSCNEVLNKQLNIMTQKDISNVYNLMEQQKDYFRVLLIIVLIFCSLFMLLISHMLTKPLMTLKTASENFGKGNYDERVNINTSDEIGVLAHTYNEMATAVSNHMVELQDMVTRREQFVADFTHEMKTPMTSIIGYADTIRSRELPRETQIMAASYIFTEGKRLENMSMKLFDLIYTGSNELKLVPTNTSKLMSEVKASILPGLDQKNIVFEFLCEIAIIDAEPELLKSALINLIDNARKASSEGSKIIFKGTISDDKYVISVQDFGIGISKENVTRICDEFFMVDKSRSRKEGGAGLGMSLASLIIKKHNAVLNIDSVLNEGTTMSIEFNAFSLPKTKEEENEV